MQVFRLFLSSVALLMCMWALLFALTSCTTNIDYGLGSPSPEVDIWIDSFVQVGSYEEIDIIWVIDRSCSMADNDAELLVGVEAMMNSLPADINWRLQMITTGLFGQPSVFPLTQGSDSADALFMLSNLPSDYHEAGFQALYDYIQHDAYAHTWMRRSAALLVVFVSDEDEQSSMSVSDFNMWYDVQRTNTYMSSIVNVDIAESACIYPSKNNVGHRYIDSTNYFNGNIIDICSSDWSAGVAEATSKVEPIESLELTHEPDIDSIVVFIDGLPNLDWHYDETTNTLYFDVTPLESAFVEVGYAVTEYILDESSDTAAPLP